MASIHLFVNTDLTRVKIGFTRGHQPRRTKMAPGEDDILDAVAAIRDEYARMRMESLSQMEMWAAQGDSVETSIHSTDAERHNAALLASNRILQILQDVATNRSRPA
jgi:hypothetical protein